MGQIAPELEAPRVPRIGLLVVEPDLSTLALKQVEMSYLAVQGGLIVRPTI